MRKTEEVVILASLLLVFIYKYSNFVFYFETNLDSFEKEERNKIKKWIIVIEVWCFGLTLLNES